MVSMADRYEINAALERLVADGATFDPSDAAILIERLPVSAKSYDFSWTFLDERPQDGVEGYAPGIGKVRGRDDKPRRTDARVGPEVHRVGGYKLTHQRGLVRIALMWAGTKIDPTGTPIPDQTALLRYDPRTRAPTRLYQEVPRTLNITLWPKPRLGFALRLMQPVVWKTPAEPGSPAALEATRTHGERQETDRGGQAEFVAGGALRAL